MKTLGHIKLRQAVNRAVAAHNSVAHEAIKIALDQSRIEVNETDAQNRPAK
jgi:hypothetical protein